MDSAPPQPAEFDHLLAEKSFDVDALSFSEVRTLDDLYREAEADRVGLEKSEFASALLTIGARYNYGLPTGSQATPTQAQAFHRNLQLHDLALTQACALGRDAAWQQFLARFRAPLTQAAVAITGSASMGRDLADSLYSELFGLTERDGKRRSPLASYSGRGSLMGWLRTTLAQRHVDHHRRTYRESPLEKHDFAAAPPAPTPQPQTITRLEISLSTVLRALQPEERFILSAWFLDRHTLLEISRLLRVHEATVSRKLKRLTSTLHKEFLKDLQRSGMSRRAAEEALGTDPRDLNINLRNLLQTSQTRAFYDQAASSETKNA